MMEKLFVTGTFSFLYCVNQYFILLYNAKFFHKVHEKELTEHTASWAEVTENLEMCFYYLPNS